MNCAYRSYSVYDLFVYPGIAMEKEQKSEANLTAGEIQKFRTMLLAKRNEILSNVAYMETEALRIQRSDLSNMPIHMADLGTDNYEVENTLEIVNSERKLIMEIDEALQRIEDGTYGICEGSGEPIPKQRLEAIPWARCCVACAGLLEKGILKREDIFNKYDYALGIEDEQDINFRQSQKRELEP